MLAADDCSFEVSPEDLPVLRRSLATLSGSGKVRVRVYRPASGRRKGCGIPGRLLDIAFTKIASFDALQLGLTSRRSLTTYRLPSVHICERFAISAPQARIFLSVKSSSYQ